MSAETNDNETWYLYIGYSYGFIRPSRKWVCFDSIFAVANDTIRRVMIYFDANDAGVNSCYKSNNQAIATLDSLLSGNLGTKYVTALNVKTFVSPDGNESYNRGLAARRNDSIKEFLQRYNSDVSVDKIHFFQRERIGRSFVSWWHPTPTCRIGKKC